MTVTDAPETNETLTDRELLQRCREYAQLQDELNERAEVLRTALSKRFELVFRLNGEYRRIRTGIYATDPLKVEVVHVIGDDE